MSSPWALSARSVRRIGRLALVGSVTALLIVTGAGTAAASVASPSASPAASRAANPAAAPAPAAPSVSGPPCGTFRDVPASSEFCADITWLKDQKITTGADDGDFHPTAPVSRQAMAAFLYRLTHPGATAASCTTAPFRDVPADSSFCAGISWLKDEKITTGADDGDFHPTAPVSRQAMAAFLFRMQYWGGGAGSCWTEPFGDVDLASVFCGDINWLVDQRITEGYPGGIFRPTAPVSRQAMAAFLYRLRHLPAGGSAAGTLVHVPIPGAVSGFHARPAWVYLPPAYTAADHRSFPLLVLIAGVPGGPNNWIRDGHLPQTMDHYAAEHHGVAPIVIVPDPTGSHTGNTMCANSRLGNAATYITRDVTDWARARLRVETDTAHWAIGGFSFGGTCALQFAVSYPRLFPTFLDISGESVPTLGNPTESVDRAFGGDEAAYRAIQPLWIMSQDAKDPAKAALLRTLDGTFSVGTEDPEYAAMQGTVVAAARKARMAVHASTYVGRHAWVDSYVVLVTALPHLAARMGLS